MWLHVWEQETYKVSLNSLVLRCDKEGLTLTILKKTQEPITLKSPPPTLRKDGESEFYFTRLFSYYFCNQNCATPYIQIQIIPGLLPRLNFYTNF